MKKITVYTDGSCLNQGNRYNISEPLKGGYAYASYEGDRLMFHGGASEYNFDVTNNRMEMMAVIAVLGILYKLGHTDEDILIKSDSTYVVDCFNDYMENWKVNGWKKKKGAIANLDLWKRLDKATDHIKFKLEWVKGHDVCEGNNLVDELAVGYAKNADKITTSIA